MLIIAAYGGICYNDVKILLAGFGYKDTGIQVMVEKLGLLFVAITVLKTKNHQMIRPMKTMIIHISITNSEFIKTYTIGGIEPNLMVTDP